MIPMKILLAEDDLDDQRLFKEFLGNRSDILLMPFKENGEELILSLKETKDNRQLPDLIILDQNMPKKNGIQTLQILQNDNHFKHIPVVIYSTYTDEFLIETASEKGAYKVVIKPVTKEGYEEMIDDLLKIVT